MALKAVRFTDDVKERDECLLKLDMSPEVDFRAFDEGNQD